MKTHKLSTSGFLFALFLLFGLTTVPAGAEELGACVKVKKKSNRSKMILVAGPEDCRKNETYIAWNVMGPEGPPGEIAIQDCDAGEFAVGIDVAGNLVCRPPQDRCYPARILCDTLDATFKARPELSDSGDFDWHTGRYVRTYVQINDYNDAVYCTLERPRSCDENGFNCVGAYAHLSIEYHGPDQVLIYQGREAESGREEELREFAYAAPNTVTRDQVIEWCVAGASYTVNDY